MADNKQNSETKNTATGKSATGSAAASTKQAKDETSSAQGGASDVIGQVKEVGGQIATQAVGQAKEKAASVIDEQKSNLAAGIGSVAESIRNIGGNIGGGEGGNKQIAALAGRYGDSLAEQVERFSDYVNDRELRELVRDVEQFAKRNPALFVGGAFMLGVLAARFLKSSGQSSNRRSRRA